MKNFRVYLIGLLLLPIVTVGALFYIPGPDGNPLMNMDQLRRNLGSFDLDWSLIEKVKQTYYKIKDKTQNVNKEDTLPVILKYTEELNEIIEPPPETLFKWRDKNGNWHFSNQLPPDGMEFKIVESE